MKSLVADDRAISCVAPMTKDMRIGGLAFMTTDRVGWSGRAADEAPNTLD